MSDLRQYELWARTLAHKRRADVARREVERAAAMGRFVVSTSWGKDSVALLDVAIEVLGMVDAMHLRSSYELPGGEHVESYFSERCHVHTVPAARTLAEVIAWLGAIGLDYERTVAKRAGVKRKADAGIGWTTANGFAVQALGMRAEESKARRMCFRVRGLTYPAHGMIVSNPIGWWETKDTWARIASRGLPYHRLYDAETHGHTRETLRNSGWLTVSPADDGRAAWLRRHYPDQWRMLACEFPRVGLIS